MTFSLWFDGSQENLEWKNMLFSILQMVWIILLPPLVVVWKEFFPQIHDIFFFYYKLCVAVTLWNSLI